MGEDLVLVLNIVVDVVFIVEDFFKVILVFITVDAQGSDLVVSLEEGIFVGFKGVGDFYVCLIDGRVVLAASVNNGGQVRLQRVKEAGEFSARINAHAIYSTTYAPMVCAGQSYSGLNAEL